MVDADQKKRDGKKKITEAEINVIHGEVEKHFSLLNDKFSTAKEIGKFGQKSAGVSAVGVAQRTPKNRRGNTKKEAKKVYSLVRKEQRQTGGGPEI